MNALQGDLDAFPLEDVMRFLSDAERTGVLRVEAGPYTGRTFFVEGRITFATTRTGDGSIAALRGFSTVPNATAADETLVVGGPWQHGPSSSSRWSKCL